MGMTMSQKILAAHAGLPEVKAGQLIEAKLDMVLGNDVTSPVAINVFEDCKATGVFDNTKIAMIMDHFTPNKDIKSAQHCLQVRNFANKYDIKNFMDVGEMGIEHALLPEKGLVGPGSLCIGADSHTCTYGALGAFSTGVGSTDMAAGMISGKAWFKVPSAIKFNLIGKPQKYVSGKDVILHIIGMIGVDGALYKSMEFMGEGLQYLNIDDRLCIANMAIEAGAKNGIFPVDDITREYTNGRFQGEAVEFVADDDAEYDEEYTIDLSQLKPTVAFPHLPENTKTIDEVSKNSVSTPSTIYKVLNGDICSFSSYKGEPKYFGPSGFEPALKNIVGEETIEQLNIYCNQNNATISFIWDDSINEIVLIDIFINHLSLNKLYFDKLFEVSRKFRLPIKKKIGAVYTAKDIKKIVKILKQNESYMVESQKGPVTRIVSEKP